MKGKSGKTNMGKENIWKELKKLENEERREVRKKANLESIKKYLNEQEIKFLSDDKDGFVAIGFSDVGITFRVSDESVNVRMDFFKELPDEAYQEVLVYLNKVNSILKEGHFEVERGRGINYGINTHMEKGATLSPSRVEEMMFLCGNVGGRFGPGIEDIIDNRLDGETAFGIMIADLLNVVMKSKEV